MTTLTRATQLVPGLALTIAVGGLAIGVTAIERRLIGHAVIDGLVVAILIGMLVRTLWTPADVFTAGIDFAAKEVLEVAILLLGASIDVPVLLNAGPALAIGIVVLVVAALALGYAIGRAMRLPSPLAILVACGNAICGNSAIVAVAPIVGAERQQVASAIAFTAILGIAAVIGLPLLMPLLSLSDYQYGVLAGLTIYSVPQVLAATLPVSELSGQVGTLVKLVRVLMLGPVVLVFALVGSRQGRKDRTARSALPIAQFVPSFIVGFVVLAVLRSIGVIPTEVADQLRSVSSVLTVGAMAALGLSVDLRELRGVGAPVVLTATLALALLMAGSLLLLRLLAIT